LSFRVNAAVRHTCAQPLRASPGRPFRLGVGEGDVHLEGRPRAGRPTGVRSARAPKPPIPFSLVLTVRLSGLPADGRYAFSHHLR
jgi:hypothetical protein